MEIRKWLLWPRDCWSHRREGALSLKSCAAGRKTKNVHHRLLNGADRRLKVGDHWLNKWCAWTDRSSVRRGFEREYSTLATKSSAKPLKLSDKNRSFVTEVIRYCNTEGNTRRARNWRPDEKWTLGSYYLLHWGLAFRPRSCHRQWSCLDSNVEKKAVKFVNIYS